MLAPVIAGLGLIAGGLAAAVLGKSKPMFAVICFRGRQVVGRMFSDVAEAEKFQEELSRQGRGSIIVQKVKAKTGNGHTYESLHPVQSMRPGRPGMKGLGFAIAPPGYWLVKWRAAGSMKEHIEIFPFEREAKERESDLRQMAAMVSTSMVPRTRHTETKAPPKKLGSFKPPYDTREAQENEMLITTRWPAAERFIRAKNGPYPETAIYTDNKEVVVPLFDSTVSSHEWRTSVVTQPVAKDLMTRQPEMLTVVQHLQDPG